MTTSERKRIPDPCLLPKKKKKEKGREESAVGIQEMSSALEHTFSLKYSKKNNLKVRWKKPFTASRGRNSLLQLP